MSLTRAIEMLRAERREALRAINWDVKGSRDYVKGVADGLKRAIRYLYQIRAEVHQAEKARKEEARIFTHEELAQTLKTVHGRLIQCDYKGAREFLRRVMEQKS